MLDREETQKQLDKFRKYVIQQAKSNLSKSKKNSSKKLYDSINGVSKVNPNSISLYFEMFDYGLYQDKGVKGLKSNYVENKNTPYSYKKGVPSRQMIKNLDKWIVRKGIAPRDAKGRLMNRQGLKFAIAKSIFNKGIKASLFFTKPFEKAYKNLPNELISAYGLDITKIFTDTIDTKK
jgi:hypothetical protein